MAEQLPPDQKRELLNRDMARRRKDRRAQDREAISKWARSRLETMKPAQQQQAVQPGGKPKKKRSKARSKARGSKQARLMNAAARAEVDRLVTPEAQRNGDFQMVPFTDIEVTEGGKRVKKEVRVVRNLGRTQVERWHARGVFNERQMAAILFYQHAHRMVFGEGPKMTASYSPAVVRGAQGAVELWAGSKIAAREALRLIDHEVNWKFEVMSGVWSVWQNVVIWDQPSGVAGVMAGFTNKPAEAAAKMIILMVASMIADIVIDSSRRDFGDLILDLDTPRKRRNSKP